MAAKKENPKTPAPAKKQASTAKAKSANPKVSTDKVTKTPAPTGKEHFRFSWSKKRPGASTIRIELDEASTELIRQVELDAKKATSTSKGIKGKAVVSSATKVTGPAKTKSKVLEEFSKNTSSEASEASTPRKLLFRPKQTQSKDSDKGVQPDPYNSDEYELSSSDDEEDDGDDDDYRFPITVDPITPGRKLVGPDHPSVPKTTNPMSRHRKRGAYPIDEQDPNGRKFGRKLVPWHRPRMLEKAMLFLDYECHQNGIEIPWDKIVKRMQPGSSGASLTQHLEKTRFRLVAEGHIVPPDKLKPELVMGDWVRALVRADPKGDPGKVRLVTWDEDVKHRHTNLETPGITTGSGKYRRGPNGRKSLAGSHRNEPRLKLEYPAVYDKTLNERLAKVADDKTKARRERAKQKRVEQRRIQRLEWDERAKANEDAGDPDAEFKDELESPKQPTRRSTRKSAGQKKKDTSDTESPMMQFSSISSVTPREMSTLPVKLSLSPEKLSNFPAGQSGSRSGEDLGADYVEDKNIENNIADKENIENGNADKENLEDGNTEEVVTAPELEHSGSSPAPVNEHNAHEGVGNETMEVDDEMIDVRESVEPDINYQGHSPLPTWYSVVEPAARRVSNDFGINPDPEDDVFGRLNSSPPTMSTWNGYGDMTNNSGSAYQSSNPYSAVTPEGPFEYDGYDVVGAIAHDHQGVAAQHDLSYDPENSFRSYVLEGHGMHLAAEFDDYGAGAITPQPYQTYFDEQDENVPPGGLQSPGYHDYGDHHSYDDSQDLQ